MVFCSKCGEKLAEDANFCQKCGARTKKGVDAGVNAFSEDWREGLHTMERELEKAFSTASKEIEKAFKTARENTRKTTHGDTVTCSSCGQGNPEGASFCHKCGKKLD